MTTKVADTGESFSLRVQIAPERAAIQTPTIVTAYLTNVSSAAIVVNRRMLLNHPGLPGEMWFHVVGPPGYRNTMGFRANVNDAPEDHYVRLLPGAHVLREWHLEDFVSTQTFGDYAITLTYHVDSARSPCGQLVSVGTISATSRFTRH